MHHADESLAVKRVGWWLFSSFFGGVWSLLVIFCGGVSRFFLPPFCLFFLLFFWGFPFFFGLPGERSVRCSRRWDRGGLDPG